MHILNLRDVKLFHKHTRQTLKSLQNQPISIFTMVIVTEQRSDCAFGDKFA